MRIFVKAKSGAKKNSVEKEDGSHFVVSTPARPQQGKANQAVAKLLANYFDIAPSRVRIISGHSSRQKVFEVG
ncbi:MAG: DUF167 domain-containing protein [Parcubacteria group bacterium]|nr:DUF167 domain-containing protein [Parcubacteria group bacterium]